MSSDRDLVAAAFDAWSKGSAYIADLFAEDLTWEIAGRSAAAGRYGNRQQFVDEVLHPFGGRFSAQHPFRPVSIRAIYEDEVACTVIVVWDGEGTTTAGTTYANTYAWFLTLEAGKVTKGTAFYDSIAFDELWRDVPPAG